MKQILMPFEEYEAERKKWMKEGVSTGIFLVLEQITGGIPFIESGYQDNENNIRYIKEIESFIKGDN